MTADREDEEESHDEQEQNDIESYFLVWRLNTDYHDRRPQHPGEPTKEWDESIVGESSAQPKIEPKTIIELKHLSKGYASGGKSVAILRDLSLEVPENSLSIIIGRSGSGKSTLLNLIAGLDFPDSGEVILSGESLKGRTAEELALYRLRSIGLVFQFFNLLPTLSLLENVFLPAVLAGESHIPARQRGQELLERVGIAHRALQLPSEVSGGEMQRAAIARALINRPSLVLADEPTGNLDEETALEVQTLFRDLVRTERTSFLVVTHDDRLIQGADHCFLLEHGKIHRQTLAET